jgi:hypothetical protein
MTPNATSNTFKQGSLVNNGGTRSLVIEFGEPTLSIDTDRRHALVRLIQTVYGVDKAEVTKTGVKVDITVVLPQMVKDIYDAVMNALMLNEVIPNALTWPDYVDTTKTECMA